MHLVTSYDAVLLLESGTVSMVNTSMVANQGVVTGGVAAEGINSMSFQGCKFSGNQGIVAVLIAVAATIPLTISFAGLLLCRYNFSLVSKMHQHTRCTLLVEAAVSAMATT